MLPASLTELVLLQRKMFEDMDSDGSGEVTREEMRDNLKLLDMDIDDHTTWGLVESIDVGVESVAGYFEQELSGEAITVRVQTRCWETDQDITGFDACAVYDPRLVAHADNGTCQVILARRLEIRHLGHLAT